MIQDEPLSDHVITNIQQPTIDKFNKTSDDSKMVDKRVNRIVSHRVADILYQKTLKSTDQDSFYVCDLGEVERQFQQWQHLMPRVKPFYGI